jgi:hypothetical protein
MGGRIYDDYNDDHHSGDYDDNYDNDYNQLTTTTTTTTIRSVEGPTAIVRPQPVLIARFPVFKASIG